MGSTLQVHIEFIEFEVSNDRAVHRSLLTDIRTELSEHPFCFKWFLQSVVNARQRGFHLIVVSIIVLNGYIRFWFEIDELVTGRTAGNQEPDRKYIAECFHDSRLMVT